MNLYDIGQKITLKAAATNRALTNAELETFIEEGTLPEGIGVDPTTVTCTLRSPGDENTEPEVTKVGTGIYKAEVTPEEAGIWLYAFDGTGAYVTAGEEAFRMRDQAVPR